MLEELRLYYPLKPLIIGQMFGENALPLYAELGLKGHNGWDLGARTGDPIYAAHDGIIIANYSDVNSGWTVGIRTDKAYIFGAGEAHYKTIYCHMREKSFCTIDQKVRTGDVIGYVGMTGNTTGPHLHFGLKPQYLNESNGVLVNADQNNGYFGAIDPKGFFVGIYASDVPAKISALQQQVLNLLNTLIGLLQKKNG